MPTRSHLRSTITLLLTLLLSTLTGLQETYARIDDDWWNHQWPYRILLQVNEAGTITNELNFSQEFAKLGISNALLDLRSLRLIPTTAGIPGDPIPFEETFSQIISDADELILSTSYDEMGWGILEESTDFEINSTPKTQGEGSLHAHIEITDTTQHDFGFYYNLVGSPFFDLSDYDVLLYDIYPSISEDLINTKPELVYFEFEGVKNCRDEFINGPELMMNSWNKIDFPLRPYGICAGPDLSRINKIKFFFKKDNFNYSDAAIMDFWMDYLRLYDQEANGQITWNAEENVDAYYLYFDVLRYQYILPLVFR